MKLPEEIRAALRIKPEDHPNVSLLDLLSEAIVRDCADQVPMNWCDPLLTGPDAVVTNLDCRQVEALLTALKKRILARYGLEEKK